MKEKLLLVGDNPFHGISHLSQERSRARISVSEDPDAAAGLVCLALDNGANGFMFSVSETTLAILKKVREKCEISRLGLYAIVPYAYEYVRLATQTGGLVGLAKRFSRQLVTSRNLGAIASGVKGVLGMNPEALLRTYLSYEISRIKSAAGKDARIESVLLHEVITDMALALNLDWLFKAYSRYLSKQNIAVGYNTCNFASLVSKLRYWNENLDETMIAAPFNPVGFEMNPSREDCEKALAGLGASATIAISSLAGGYLKLPEAVDYLAKLPNIKGVAVGVSNNKQALETFSFIRNRFNIRSILPRVRFNVKVSVKTNGCAEGQLSSTYVEQFFKKNKVDVTKDLTEANMLFFWACGLTEQRERDSLAVIREIQRKMKPDARLIVWGCLPKINPESLATAYDGPMIGPDDKGFFESTLEKVIAPFDPMEIGWAQNMLVPSQDCLEPEGQRSDAFADALTLLKNDYGRLWERARKNFKYFIRVASGCTGRCTYCSERCAFGKVKSRPVISVLSDLERGLTYGYNRFSLIATDLGAYGRDIGCTLPDLLEKMTRFTYKRDYKIILNQVNPFYLKEMFSGLEGNLASGKIETLNCPVQSGSEKILRLMGRQHTAKDWRNYMVRINRKFPNVKLSTHFMVGFPGETDEDFKATLKLLDHPLSLESIVIFKYSGRPRVYATRMPGQVSEETKELRSRMLQRKHLRRYFSGFAFNWLHRTF